MLCDVRKLSRGTERELSGLLRVISVLLFFMLMPVRNKLEPGLIVFMMVVSYCLTDKLLQITSCISIKIFIVQVLRQHGLLIFAVSFLVWFQEKKILC